MDNSHLLRILIVESEAAIAEKLRTSLQSFGYYIPEVASGYVQALQLLEKEHVDLAMLNVNLLGTKDAIKLGRVLRKEYDIPFLFLISNAEDEITKRTRKAGPNGYLEMPFTQEGLHRAIELGLHYLATGAEHTEPPKGDKGLHSFVIKNSFFVKVRGTYIRLHFKDVLYLKASNNYTHIQVPGYSYLVRGTLGETLQKLPENIFFRAHRSSAINVRHIKAICPASVMVGEEEVPLNKEQRTHLLAMLNTV